MKTLKALLKKAFGPQLFSFASIWLLWLGIDGHLQTATSLYIIKIWKICTIFLVIWSIGYLFSVACRFMKDEKKPLTPLFSKAVFILGFNLSFRLFLIFIPLVLIGAVLYFFPPNFKYFKTIALSYIVLVIAPYLLLWTVKCEKMPFFRGFFSNFAKNASNAFAFVFWSTFSFTLFAYFAGFIYLATIRTVNSIFALTAIIIILLLLSFYILTFVSILLGFFAKKVLNNQKEVK